MERSSVALTLICNLAGKYRREVVDGREYYVAPMTLIVPGVLPGSRGPLYYPPEECAATVSAWNGMPLTARHPEGTYGEELSARDEGVAQRQGIGFVRAAAFNQRLRAEAWFDVERTRSIDNRIYAALEAGRPFEISTGLNVDVHEQPGIHRGRYYDGVARNYRPDHVAVLMDQRGACSVADGCGVYNSCCNAEQGRDEHGRFAAGEASQKALAASVAHGHTTGLSRAKDAAVTSDMAVDERNPKDAASLHDLAASTHSAAGMYHGMDGSKKGLAAEALHYAASDAHHAAAKSLRASMANNAFASEDQRRFMWSQHPEIAKKWAHDEHSSDKDHKMPEEYGEDVRGPIAAKAREKAKMAKNSNKGFWKWLLRAVFNAQAAEPPRAKDGTFSSGKKDGKGGGGNSLGDPNQPSDEDAQLEAMGIKSTKNANLTDWSSGGDDDDDEAEEEPRPDGRGTTSLKPGPTKTGKKDALRERNNPSSMLTDPPVGNTMGDMNQGAQAMSVKAAQASDRAGGSSDSDNALSASRDGNSSDAAEAHTNAAEFHDDAGQRTDDEDQQDNHQQAAALHRKAAALHRVSGATQNMVYNKEFTSDEERKAAFAHMNGDGDSESSKATTKAVAASKEADKKGTAGAHRAASKAHAEAGHAAYTAGNNDRAASHFRVSMHHSSKAGGQHGNAKVDNRLVAVNRLIANGTASELDRAFLIAMSDRAFSVFNDKAEGSNADVSGGGGYVQAGGEDDTDDDETGPNMKSDPGKGLDYSKPVKAKCDNSAAAEQEWLRSAPPRIRRAVHNAMEVEAREQAAIVNRLIANVYNPSVRQRLAAKYMRLPLPELRDMLLMVPQQGGVSNELSQLGDPAPLYNGAQGAPVPIDNAYGDDNGVADAMPVTTLNFDAERKAFEDKLTRRAQ